MDIDTILRHALSPKDKPAASVNRQLLSKIQEENHMRRRIFVKSRVAAAVAVAVILTVGSVSAYAAWKYLTPSEVAGNVKDYGLAKAFDSEDAVVINKTVSDSGFDITLLGMVSGKALSSLPWQQVEFTTIAGQCSGAQERVKKDSTYCVIAIKHSGEEESGRKVMSDGQQIDNREDDADRRSKFIVSPFIQGQKPWDYNIWSMSGGASSYEENGVYYRIIQCDDLEVFANRTVYLGVTNAGYVDGSVYGYNRNTGEICSQKGWQGLNVLFTLPFDKEKADDKKAEELLKQWQEEAEIGTGVYVFQDDDWKMRREDSWTVENVLENAEPVKGTKQVLAIDSYGLTQDAQPWEYRGIKVLTSGCGVTRWFYDSEGNSVENSWKVSEEENREYYAKLSVEKGTAVIVAAAAFERAAGEVAEEFRLFQVLTWNGDGTVTYCAYHA